MRVAFIASGLKRGGAEAQLIALARQLVRRGHAVAIYTLSTELDRLAELDGSGVQVCTDQKRWKFDLAVLSRLIRFLRRFRADLVQGFLYDGNLYGRVAARVVGVPAFDSERNDDYRLTSWQRLGMALTRHLADAVVANTWAGARFAQRLYGLPDNAIHAVWNGIDLARVDERLASSKDNYAQEFFGTTDIAIAVLVGNLRPEKDYRLALNVARELTRSEHWHVLFLGEHVHGPGSYKQEIMDEYQKIPNKTRIVFGGGRADAVEIIGQCDVLFSTSIHEGFPNVVLEAMSVGVPVVSTTYSDIHEILPCDWQIVADRDPVALAQAIERARGERRRLAPLQRDWVERNATIEVSAERLEAIYVRYIDACKQSDANAEKTSEIWH